MNADRERSSLDLDRLVAEAREIATGPTSHPTWRVRDALTGLADLIEQHARQAAAYKYALDAIAVMLQQPTGNNAEVLAFVTELVAQARTATATEANPPTR